MHIPGLPEEISFDSVRAAHEALGLPIDEGRITKVELVPGSVVVSFFRESETQASPAQSAILAGGRDSLARVAVPIVVRERKVTEASATVTDWPPTATP